jgi:hypothetical protein
MQKEIEPVEYQMEMYRAAIIFTRLSLNNWRRTGI